MLRVIGAIGIVVTFFFGTLWAIDRFSAPSALQKPVLAQMQPLLPATRQSVVIAPVAVAIPAIREAMERATPRDLSGQPDNPLAKLMSKAEIGFTIQRSPLTLPGRPDGLTVATTLDGSLRITGQLAGQLSDVGGAITGLISNNLGRGVKDAGDRVLDQRADIRGDVAVVARPAITTNWRLEPNLTAQVNINDANLQFAGVKLNTGKEIKPLVDRSVAEQVAALRTRLRNDPLLEETARREWTKMCRSIPLGSAGGLPDLWLEMRPTRAFAAQPRIDANNVTLTLGIQAGTRIVPQETKPTCTFPHKLEIVQQLERGNIAIGVPIDVPFAEVNKLVEAQLKGRTFPDDGSGPVDVTVQSAHVSAAGERLLISLLVKVREKKSWFGFGTEATVHIWGKPGLDTERQIMRLDNVTLAVESEAAFGLLGAAAKAAMPYLQTALEKNTSVDLKPFLANARSAIDKSLSDFRGQGDGIDVRATVTGLRLMGIEYDSKILRIIAEADGAARVAVTKLP